MRAELRISYTDGDMRAVLESLYGANDTDVLSMSQFARKAPASVRAIDFAARTPGLIVMAWLSPGQVELYVESAGGRLREGAAHVWDTIRENSTALRPTLRRLAVFDEDANDELITASWGVRDRFWREGLFIPLVTGLVTLVVLIAAEAVDDPSPDFLWGSATALFVAILSLARVLWLSKSKELVWR